MRAPSRTGGRGSLQARSDHRASWPPPRRARAQALRWVQAVRAAPKPAGRRGCHCEITIGVGLLRSRCSRRCGLESGVRLFALLRVLLEDAFHRVAADAQRSSDRPAACSFLGHLHRLKDQLFTGVPASPHRPRSSLRSRAPRHQGARPIGPTALTTSLSHARRHRCPFGR